MLKEQLRRDAGQIIDRAIQAVKPDEAVHRALNPVMFPGRVVLVAVGKSYASKVDDAKSAFWKRNKYPTAKV